MDRRPGYDVLSNAREHSDGGGSGGGDDGGGGDGGGCGDAGGGSGAGDVGGGDCDLLLILVLNSELLVCATIHKSLRDRVVFVWRKFLENH